VPLKILERNLGYIFTDRALLERALTTIPHANEAGQHGRACQDQDVLCTLGDAVLKAVLVDHLMEQGYETSGDITAEKIALEREESLASIARKLKVGDHLRLGVGERKSGAADHPNLLAETLEAIIAAIYLDVGFRATRRIIIKWFAIKP